MRLFQFDIELMIDYEPFIAFVEAENEEGTRTLTTVKALIEVADNVWAALEPEHLHLVDNIINDPDWIATEFPDYE